MGRLLESPLLFSLLVMFQFLLLALTYRVGFHMGALNRLEKSKEGFRGNFTLMDDNQRLRRRLDYIQAENDSLRRQFKYGYQKIGNTLHHPPTPPDRRVYGDGLINPIQQAKQTAEWRDLLNSAKFNPGKMRPHCGDPDCEFCGPSKNNQTRVKPS